MRKYLTTALAVVVSLFMTMTARASTIEAHLQTVTPSGPNFVYDYQLVLTNGNGLSNSGDGFESGLIILDFLGLVGAPTLSVSGTDVTAIADWNLNTPATGGSPLNNTSNAAGITTIVGTNPFNFAGGLDSAAASNIVLQYAGANMLVDLLNPRNLIHLSVTSTIGTHAPTVVSLSRDTGPSDDARPTETYSIDAPVAGVPLPAAAWAGFALFGGLGLRRRGRGEIASA